ncbi:TPA: VirB3 family type IV secretion system protein [Escherichia coli]
MTILNKALTRPAALWGVPLVPLLFTLCILTLAAVWSRFYWLLLLLIPAFIELRRLAKEDIHFFDLKLLAFKTRGNRAATRHFGTKALVANQYDAIDVTEFIKHMRLNESIPLSRYLPWSSHLHEQVVKNKKGDFVSTWEIGGTIFECEDEHYLATLDMQLNNVIRSFEGLPVTFYTHLVSDEFTDTLECESGIPFSDEIARLFYASREGKPFYQRRLFFTVCFNPHTGIERATMKQKSLGERKTLLDNALQVMQEHRQAIGTALSRYAARPLGTYEENGHVFSSQLAFYNFLITGRWQKVRVTRTPFYDVLGGTDIFPSTDIGQVSHTDGQSYFRGLEIKDYSTETITGLYDSLLYARCRYVFTQSYTCMGKDEARGCIRTIEKRLKSAEDDAISQQEDLKVARDMLQSGIISFGKYHQTLIVSAPTSEQVIRDTNTLADTLKDLGFIMTLSRESLSAAYLAQLPGVYHLRPRLVPVSSLNYAEMVSFHNFHPHKRDGNAWGEAIAVVPTPSGGCQYVNLHNSQADVDEFSEKPPGNTMLLGSTGTGKSTLLMMFQHLMQKYRRPESFAPGATKKRFTSVVFDKDRSAEMSIRLQGGSYFRFRSGEKAGLNPFALAPTKRNRNFLKKLMRMICTRDGKPLDPRDEERLSEAVDTIMLDYPPELRRNGITRMLEVLHEAPTKDARMNGLRIRLQQWAQGGEFGWVFDNDVDTFDIDNIDNFGIDGTEFLDDKDVRSPLTFYLLYRVTSLLDGRRLVIFMDEFWKWLQDPEFSKFALDMLKVIRKLNGIFFPATQSPEEMCKHEISAAIIEQCSTRIFMANQQAKEYDYVDMLRVPKAVYDIVTTLDPYARQMVIMKSPLRRGDVRPYIAQITLDLSGLGRYTKLLSASADNLKIFDEIWQEGMKPEDWKDEMLRRAV